MQRNVSRARTHEVLRVPGCLAAAVRDQTVNGRSHRGVGVSPAVTGWGCSPGQHARTLDDPVHARRTAQGDRHLRRPGRRAALLDLAAQMPAAVLAEALGLHQATAARWMHQAGGD